MAYWRFVVLGWIACAAGQAQNAPVINAITTLDQPFDVEIPGLIIPPAIAKESVFLIWGENLGPETGASSEDPLNPPVELAGTQVRITADDGTRLSATLLWASATQLNVVLPRGVQTGQVQVHVIRAGVESNTSRLKAVTQRPRLMDYQAPFGPFFSVQRPIVQRAFADGSRQLVSAENPARPGDTLIVWATGVRRNGPPGGDIVGWVRLDGRDYLASYAGPSGCCDGVDQIQFTLPSEIAGSCFTGVSFGSPDGLWSDREMLAIAEEGRTCERQSQTRPNGSRGMINFLRHEGLGGSIDTFNASFRRDVPLPAELVSTEHGTCSASVLAGSFIFDAEALDIGANLTVETPERTYELAGDSGAFHRAATTPDEFFLGAGRFVVSAPGGADLDSFTAEIEGIDPATVSLEPSFAGFTPDRPPVLRWPAGAAPDSVALVARVRTDASEEMLDEQERFLIEQSPRRFASCQPDSATGELTVPAWFVETANWLRWNGLASESSFENVIVATGQWSNSAELDLQGLDDARISYSHSKEISLAYDGPVFAQTPVHLSNGEAVLAELATTSTERARGLMLRQSLAPHRGMLFQFPFSGSHPFWMLRTLIPLDIIWLNRAKEIVFINPDTPPCPESPCPTYGGAVTSKWVLELAAGETARRGLAVGDRLDW